MKSNIMKIVAIGLAASVMVAPMTVSAQRKTTKKIAQRQKTKGEWQKAAYVGAALGLLGQLGKDKTISYVGTAGALYSLYRYDQDSKSQDKLRKQRAAFYGRTHYTSHGVRYDRKTVKKNGHSYYTFVKHK